MLKLKKLMTIVLTTATLTGASISVNSVQALAKGNGKVAEKAELKVYNSTTALQDSDLKTKFVASAKFFEDPYDNKRTVFLSTDGSFINSELKQRGSYNEGSMYWPSAYECSIEVSDEKNSGGETQIVSSTPKNTIKSSRVSNTVGYSIGGVIGVVKDAHTATVSANYTQSQNISYDQENFTTVQNKDTIHGSNWKVQFDSTPDGYDRDYYTAYCGNPMFMKTLRKNTGKENLKSPDKLPTLISGGFSPNYLVALKAPKNKKETIVDITFKRHTDFYKIQWCIGLKWVGINKYDNEKKSTKRFIINWNKHTIRSVEEIEKEKDTKEIKEIVKKLNNEDNKIFESTPQTQEKIALRKRVEELEKQGKITRDFEDNPSETQILPNGGVIIGGRWIWKVA